MGACDEGSCSPKMRGLDVCGDQCSGRWNSSGRSSEAGRPWSVVATGRMAAWSREGGRSVDELWMGKLWPGQGG